MSNALMRQSDDFMRDARSGVQSTRGQWNSCIEGGYLALLSVLAPSERSAPGHPSDEVVRRACERLAIDADESLLMTRQRFAPDVSMSFMQALAWAERVRASAKQFLEIK